MNIKNSTRIILLLSVVLLLIGSALIIQRNENFEWKKYQKKYLDMAIEKTQDKRLKEILKNKTLSIAQVIVRDFGEEQIDRCTTCHISIDDDRFKDDPQPFKTHPAILKSHPYRKFGCTVCHDGNGRGLTAYDAHGVDHFWIRTMLKGDMVESSCAKCHPHPYIAEAKKLKEGSQLFITKACSSCHKIEGFSNGKLGIELTGAGSKWDLHYLKESIVDPKANNPESLMPELKLTKNEVASLLIFLRSLTGENLAEGPVQSHNRLKDWRNKKRPEVEVSIDSGKKIFNDFGCSACHRVNGVGQLVAPELSYVGLQRTKEWLIQHFINPRSLVAGSLMPDFDFSKTELEAITLYLQSLTGSNRIQENQTEENKNEN